MNVEAPITFVTRLMLCPDICGFKNIIEPDHVASKKLDDQVSHFLTLPLNSAINWKPANK